METRSMYAVVKWRWIRWKLVRLKICVPDSDGADRRARCFVFCLACLESWTVIWCSSEMYVSESLFANCPKRFFNSFASWSKQKFSRKFNWSYHLAVVAGKTDSLWYIIFIRPWLFLSEIIIMKREAFSSTLSHMLINELEIGKNYLTRSTVCGTCNFKVTKHISLLSNSEIKTEGQLQTCENSIAVWALAVVQFQLRNFQSMFLKT